VRRLPLSPAPSIVDPDSRAVAPAAAPLARCVATVRTVFAMSSSAPLGRPPVAALRLGGSLLLGLMLAPVGEAAWRAELTPGVRVATEYSDNVTYADKARDPVSDLSLTTEPSFDWSLDRGDLRLVGRSRERFERFLDHDELDGNDPGHRVTLTWQPVERWTVEVSEDFERIRDLTEAVAAGEIVVERERRTTNDAEATLTYRPTERLSVAGAYTNYNSQSSNPANTDYLLHAAQLTTSLQLTEQFGFSLGANLQDYDFNPFPGSRTRFFTRNYGLFLGAGYQVNERLQLSAQLGERLTEQTARFPVLDATPFPPRFVEQQDTTSDLANTFSTLASYQLERGSITLSASQDLTATSGAEGTVERRRLSLSGNRWLTEAWQVGGSIASTTNQSNTDQAGFVSRNTRSLSGNADLTYRFDEVWSAGFSVRHVQYRDTDLQTEVERNAALVSLSARWPYLL